MWVLYGMKCVDKFAVQDMLDLHATSCLTLHSNSPLPYVYIYIHTYVIVSGELRTCEQQNQYQLMQDVLAT